MSRTPMPPVGLLSSLEAVDHPQFIPNSPMRLPPVGDRVAKRVNQGIMGTPPSAEFGPPAAISTTTYEAHRYASLIEGTFGVPTAPSGNPFLTESSSRRNFMGFRNTAAAGGPTIYLSFGRDASTTASWLMIVPQQIILFDTVVPQDDVYAVADAAGAVLAYAFSTFVPE